MVVVFRYHIGRHCHNTAFRDTPEILQHYIDKIMIHHREETAEGKIQKVDFYFNFIGKVEMPMLYELAPYKNSFGRQKENHTAKAV